MLEKKLRKVNRNLLKLLFYVALILLGVSLGKFWNILPYYSVSKEISLTDLISATFSVLIFYLIFSYVDKEKEEGSREKNLLISRVEEVYQGVKDQSYSIIGSQLNYSTAVASVNRTRMQINAISELTTESTLKADPERILQLIVANKKVRDLLTKTLTKKEFAKYSEEEIPIQVKNGVLHFSADRIHQIENSYDHLQNKLLSFQLYLNRV